MLRVERGNTSLHKHHIVFRSQGGLDFPLNYKIYRGYDDHEGMNGPHRNREVDLQLKRELQNELMQLFTNTHYTLREIADKLDVKEKYLDQHFKRVYSHQGKYLRMDIIRKLMGGKLY